MARDAGEHVGEYNITQGTLALSSDYTLVYTGAKLSITPLTINVSAVAKTKVYGESDPALTYTFSPTLIGGDSFTGALARDAGRHVGEYNITQGTLALSSDYTLAYTGAKLSITPLTINVSAVAKTKVYGESDPALTYTFSPTLIGGDSFTGALARDAGEHVGEYNITQGTLALSSDYTLAYTGAKLSITPLTINVTPINGQFIFCGQANPAYAYGFSPTLIDDDVFSGAVIRVTGDCPGSYAITQGTLSLNTNYILNFANGVNFEIKAVSIDASESSTPVPSGIDASLIAKIYPVVRGVNVTFTLDNGTPTVFPTYYGTTDDSGTAKATVSGLSVEVYKVTASINGCITSTAAYLAVYDPNGGFVTGGGWFNSPDGALVGTHTTGKANFGFVSKYKKGSNVPEGNTEFQFQAGNLNFSSSTYNAGSLVIAGAQATYKGVGTIKGLDGNYGFMVIVTDGKINGGGGVDKFRIKIWE